VKHWLRWLVATVFLLAAPAAFASFHTFQIEQLYSNADGSVQFIVMHETQHANGENLWAGHTLTNTHAGVSRVFVFPNDLPGGSGGYLMMPSPTADKRALIATQGFAALGLVTPDYVIQNGFLTTDGGTLNYAGVDILPYPALPTDGVNAINRNGVAIPNVATNFAGASASVTGPLPTAPSSVENPQPGSYHSGIALFSGWSCEGPAIGVSIDGGTPRTVPYGSERGDTASVCGASNVNTGFGLLFNFNLFGAGSHTAQLFVNGAARGNPVQFNVAVPSGEFLTGASKEVTVPDFPTPGRTTVLIWQQSEQNFAIKSVSP
jgi:hypothetical protein